MRLETFIAVGVVALILGVAGPSAAGEIFLCADGRMLEIDASNRQALMKDPCVAEWFKNNTKTPAPKADAGQQSMTRNDTAGRNNDYYYPSYQSNPSYSYYSYGYTPYGWAD